MIPLVITMDLEAAHDHDIVEQANILETISCDMKQMGLPLTVFTTSEAAVLFPTQLKKLKTDNHEIGCHGLNHRKEENYRKISAEKAFDYISSSTENIENVIQAKPISFRGPAMTTSAGTQKVLDKLGYKSDFSVCSQRLDILNSEGGDLRWLFSPRTPYHPSESSPYKRGGSPLWVVPLSSIGLPFLSGVLYMFGLSFMRTFAEYLIEESRRTQKPIVYLFHSYEFCSYSGNSGSKNENGNKKRKLLHRFYESDQSKRYKMNTGLLNFLLTFKDVQPFTGKEYVEFLNSSSN